MRWIGCVLAFISGLLAGALEGWDYALHGNLNVIPLVAICGLVTSFATAIPACSTRKPPDDDDRGGGRYRETTREFSFLGAKWKSATREVVFIGILLPFVWGGALNLAAAYEFVFWVGTGLWAAGVLVLYADFVIGRFLRTGVQPREAEA